MMITGPKISTVDDLVATIPNGTRLGVPADYSGVPMTATRALIRRKVEDLHLYCLPLTTIQGDMLIGAGCVTSIEAAAVTLGEYGLAPRFSDAFEAGELDMRDSTCPALHAQLQAAEKGVPFMPLRGLLGTDILKHRPDWKVIDNPFATNADASGDGYADPIVLLPATKLDVALIHAQSADRNGNVWIGRKRDLATMVHAADRTLVTVEEVRDTDFLENENQTAGVLPALYVDEIAVAPNGAWPCALHGLYEEDASELRAYASAARTRDGFRRYLDERVFQELEVA